MNDKLGKLLEIVFISLVSIGGIFILDGNLPLITTGYWDAKIIDKFVIENEYGNPRFCIVLEDYTIIQIPASLYYTVNMTLPIRILLRETQLFHQSVQMIPEGLEG